MSKKSKTESGSESESLVDKDDNEESEVDEIHELRNKVTQALEDLDKQLGDMNKTQISGIERGKGYQLVLPVLKLAREFPKLINNIIEERDNEKKYAYNNHYKISKEKKVLEKEKLVLEKKIKYYEEKKSNSTASPSSITVTPMNGQPYTFKEYNNEVEKFPGYPFKNKMKIILETALGVDNKEDKVRQCINEGINYYNLKCYYILYLFISIFYYYDFNLTKLSTRVF